MDVAAYSHTLTWSLSAAAKLDSRSCCHLLGRGNGNLYSSVRLFRWLTHAHIPHTTTTTRGWWQDVQHVCWSLCRRHQLLDSADSAWKHKKRVCSLIKYSSGKVMMLRKMLRFLEGPKSFGTDVSNRFWTLQVSIPAKRGLNPAHLWSHQTSYRWFSA